MAHNHHFGTKYSKFGEDGKGQDIIFYSDIVGNYSKFEKTTGNWINGTSASPLATSVADKKFDSRYTKSTATSGDSRGFYLKHELAGITAGAGYGDAMRSWAYVSGTGYAYATGFHGTLSLKADGTITGSASGARFTLGADAQSRTLGGKLSSAHFCSDVATGNTLPTVHGFMRFTDDGAVRMSNLAVIPVASNGTIFSAHTTQTMTHSIKVIDEAGTAYYLMCTNVATNRS